MNRLRWMYVVSALGLLLAQPAPAHAAAAAATTPIQVYGAWHCGNDACTWGAVRDAGDFDRANHWLIDRGDGVPSVNLVVLSFVNPLKLLQRTTDAQTSAGVPVGMTPAVISYFSSRGIRVMLSIGGITFVDDWNTAPNLAGLQAFIDAYRSQLPYDGSGADPAARLTIDLGAGDRFLIDTARKATSDWLTSAHPVLDYANAMVPSKQPTSASDAETNWQEHVDGKPRFSPPIPPLAPARFTGSLFISAGSRVRPECTTFGSSLENTTGTYVQAVAPNGAGTTPGMLGFMFWAAETPSTHGTSTTPPNTCEGGVGVGARTYAVPIPMKALRQS